MVRSARRGPVGEGLLKRMWKTRSGYFFIAPLLLGLLVLNYYPFVSGIYHSFFDWDSIGTAKFIGLKNFRELFGDHEFLRTIPIMLKIMLPRLAISIFVPLIVAEMIFAVRSIRAKYRYRVLVLLPMVAPGVVQLLLWRFIYDPNNGLLTAVLRAVGFMGQRDVIDWMGSPHTVIGSIIFMHFPWIGGTSVLIYMSGLMNIAGEVIESTRLDGANTLQRIWYIDMPLLLGQIRYFLIFGLIGGIQDYNVQLVLTQGGPGYTSFVPGYYMYRKAFAAGRMGYASCIGVVIFVVIMTLTLIFYRYLNNDAVE